MEKSGGTEPWIPVILRIGRRGVRPKIWAFLLVNQPRWFTAQEIAKHLEMPLSTVQVALKDVRIIGPGIECRDKQKSGKGRPEKEYSYQGIPRKYF